MESLKSKQNNKQQNRHWNKVNVNIKIPVQTILKNVIAKESQYTIPIFIPHQGCPHACIFCNQKKISGQVGEASLAEVKEKIEEHLRYVKDTKRKIQIAFFGGSFTGIPVKKQEAYLALANQYITSGQVSSIRISTRPDYISPNILRRLKSYHVENIELGVQSMNTAVLEHAKRGHGRCDVIRASRLIHLFGIQLGHQMMIGLPFSNQQTEIDTVQQLLAYSPQELRIYPVYVIPPSELYEAYQTGKYIPLTLEQAVEQAYAVMKCCQKTAVQVIRMGLQSTDEICQNNHDIVGPVCDNFAEYVLARLTRDALIDAILKEIQQGTIKKGQRHYVNIFAPNQYASLIMGPKRVNALAIEKAFESYSIQLKMRPVEK